LDQGFQDFEILVVGDGCTDKTANVVADFADPRIHWFDLPKAEGFGYANRNIALRQAKGELIAFAAHDDLMLPDHLHFMATLFDARPRVQWAYCRPLWIDDEGTVMPFFLNLEADHAYRRFIQQYNSLPAGCVVHRRACFDKVGLWPVNVKQAGDWEMWRRIINTYGRSAIAVQRVPTQLHFRADWRNPEDWGPRPLSYLKAMSARKPDWPAGLKLPLTAEPAPQQQVLTMLRQDPHAFRAKLRNGVGRLQDDIAWEASLDSNFY
jgi:glycosyltransferase involved in cell wall biosynthesis